MKSMRRMRFLPLLVLLVVMALGVGPCPFIQKVGDRLCNPTPEQVQQAQAAAAFLDAFAATQPLAVQTVYYAAKGIFLMVKPGLCVAYSQLNEAVATFDGAANKVRAAKGPKVSIPNIDSLRRAMANIPNIDSLRKGSGS